MTNLDPTLVSVIGVLFCFFCLSQFVILGIVFLYRTNRSKSVGLWTGFAEKHGLAYQQPGFMQDPYGSMSGKMDGRDVTFRSYTTGTRGSVRWTEVYVRVNNPKGIILSVAAMGFDQTIYKAFGAQDIAIGVKEFDDGFVIQANPPETASRILLPNADMRAEIQTIRPYELLFKGNFTSCRVIGAQTDETALLNLLHLTQKLAEAVENSE